MANIVYELMAKIGLDDKEFQNGLNGAGKTLQSFGKTAGKIAMTGAKIAGAAVGAAATAVAAVTKQAVEAYGEYEQLAGGIETLFGTGGKTIEEYAASVGKSVSEVQDEYNSLTDAQNTVMQNAADAWKTAGLSANEYMNTAIGFSGALLKSLGGDTQEAARLTDVAISDMADQANKYGRTVEEVSQTYTSLARGNTQTLDNLFGGMFAGTKAGLEEMLDYAEQYRSSLGETVSYSSDSYADILQAIHDVSEATGVYGTTAKEASETIQGSVNSMKAAWRNLITGMADESADLDKLMDNFVDSVNTVGKNIIPRIKQIISGASKLINTAAKELVPMIIQVIVESLPDLTTAGVELIVALLNGIAEALPQLIAAIPGVIDALVTALQENWPAIKEAGGKIIEALVLGIVDMGWYLGTAFLELLGDLDSQLADFGVGVSAKVDDIGRNALDKTKEIFRTIGNALDGFISDAGDFFDDLGDRAIEYYTESKSSVEDFISTRANTISQYIQQSKQRIDDFVSNLKSLIKDGLQWLYDNTIGKLIEVANGVKEKLAQVKQHFQDLIDAAYVWGQDLLTNFADGIASMFPHLTKAVGWVTNKISSLLGHSHPKEGPLADDYKWMPDMMQLFAEGIKNNAHLVTDQIRNSFDIGDAVMGTTAPLSGISTNTNIYNITVNGIDELEELLQWYESRQVRARMA